MQDNTEQMRLQTFIAHSGYTSRREALIISGKVSINGEVITELGTKVNTCDKVCIDGEEIHLENQLHYVLLHKPVGYICSLEDTHGRKLASDILKPHFTERLYNIGRLDMYTSGAIIFTNDGGFAAKVSHPSSCIEKEYYVETVYPIDESQLKEFERGVTVDGVLYKCVSAKKTNKTKMRIILQEGKNREIRTVLASFNIKIKKLKRIRIGPIELGNLKVGEFRNLTEEEIQFFVEK